MTTITNGKVYLNKTSGYAIPGSLTISSLPDTGGVWTSPTPTFVVAQGANQVAPTCLLSFNNFNGNNFGYFELYGHSMTLAGLSGYGVVENTESESGSANSTLTINNSVDCYFGGYLRNTNNGSGTITLIKTGTGYANPLRRRHLLHRLYDHLPRHARSRQHHQLLVARPKRHQQRNPGTQLHRWKQLSPELQRRHQRRRKSDKTRRSNRHH